LLILLLTHADAQRVEEPHFRALSDQGRAQVDETAARFREVVADPDLDLPSDQLPIGEILSSPLARCVETALRFSDAVNDLVKTSEMRLDDRLRDNELSAKGLVSVLDATKSQAVLLCTHADLAGALPESTNLKPEYNRNGWFQGVRPVLVLVEYERGSGWDNANVLRCECPAYKWETLLAQ
jgi:phosphohistidine phosphatase SixA